MDFNSLSHVLLFATSLVAKMVKRLPAMRETWVRSLGWEDPWRRKWQPTPVSLPGESHGQRSLVGYSPWVTRVRHNLATKPPPPRCVIAILPRSKSLGFPGTSAGKESTRSARDLGSIPGLGRFPGKGNHYPLQYSSLENPMDQRAW